MKYKVWCTTTYETSDKAVVISAVNAHRAAELWAETSKHLLYVPKTNTYQQVLVNVADEHLRNITTLEMIPIVSAIYVAQTYRKDK